MVILSNANEYWDIQCSYEKFILEYYPIVPWYKSESECHEVITVCTDERWSLSY